MVKAWEVLYEMIDDIGITWKTDTPTLTKLADDLEFNSELASCCATTTYTFLLTKKCCRSFTPASQQGNLSYPQLKYSTNNENKRTN